MLRTYIDIESIKKEGKSLIKNPGFIFDEYMDRSIFENEAVIEIIRDIDGVTEIIHNAILINEYGEEFYKNDLSTGTKTLIVMLFADKEDIENCVFKASSLGDNCFKYLNKYLTRDIDMYLNYTPRLKAFPINMYLVEEDRYTSTFLELAPSIPMF